MTAKGNKPAHRESGKPAPAKAFVLADLVEYAEDSIVSRVIAENDAGTLTLFAFDAGQGLSEHSAPFDAIVQVLDGEARVRIGDKSATVGAGQLVIMPANVPHAIPPADKPFKMLLTMLRAKS